MFAEKKGCKDKASCEKKTEACAKKEEGKACSGEKTGAQDKACCKKGGTASADATPASDASASAPSCQKKEGGKACCQKKGEAAPARPDQGTR
jgi:hypothetical protein